MTHGANFPRPLPRLALLLATVALVTLSASSALAEEASDPSKMPAQTVDATAEGRGLFENSCSSCHGQGGQGTALGPSLTQSGAAAADFMLSTGRMPLDGPHRQAIRKPPAFDRRQIRAITAYVASLGTGPDIPAVHAASGNLSAGQELYSANCAACHSSAGAGGAVGAGLEAPALTKATPTQIVEAMRIGPGAMPAFSTTILDDQQANSIARYLLYLRRLPDHGGWGLGRIGPIPEGSVAWIAGIGALLAVCLWIGEKR